MNEASVASHTSSEGDSMEQPQRRKVTKKYT